ncbi:beta strand repeat-containing protein [Rickettsia bellii]|uniref:beta strand repeat-containing protein n=1 Tax=Rickettsia bellii TaxID=33990 RepID=UPI0000DB0F7E|nr:S-layer family protein [Rickettsia bellii]
MKNKFKILKGFLATASLYGSLISSFNTAGVTVATTGSVVLSTGAGLAGVLNNGDIIQIAVGGLGTTILADKPNAQIGGINTLLNALAFGGVQVSQNVSIGALSATVGLNPNFGPLKFIANNATATITGVGNQTFTTMDFAGKSSTLQINDNLNIATTIDNTGTAGNGTLNLGNGVTITKDIGGTNSLLAVNINGSGNINFGRIVKANAINLANATANVVATGLITGILNYNADATLFAKGGISGNVNFNANGGNFSVYSNAGQTLTANFNNLDVGAYGSVTISHNGDNAGTAATINGTVGGTNPIANFNIINGNEFSTNIVLNGAINATNILFKRDVDKNPNFTIAINNNITGAIQNVSNGKNNFVLNIADGKKITGTIDSQNVLSTIINLAGNNEITGAITNATTINFNGANIKLDSAVNSTNFVVANDGATAIVTGLMTGDLGYNAAGSVTATGGLAGNINYNDNNGTFTLGAGKTLTGSAISTGGRSGTFVFVGDGTVTENLGIDGAGLTQIIFNGTDVVQGGVDATTLTVNTGANATIAGATTGSAVYAVAGNLTSTGNFTGGVDFKSKGGTFTLGADSKLTGTVTNGNNATVIALGNGSITGAITGLNTLEFSGGTGTTLNLSDIINTSINSNITNITYTNSTNASGTINVNTDLTAGTVTFNAGNADGGTIIINAPSTIGLVANAANGTIQIKLGGSLTISDSKCWNNK